MCYSQGSKIFLVKGSPELPPKNWRIVEAYSSNKKSASPLLSLMGTLTAMGIPRDVQENMAGVYKVQVTKNKIEFDLGRVKK